MQLRWIALVALPLLLAGIACSSNGLSSSNSFATAGGVGSATTPLGTSPGPCPVDPYATDARCVVPLRCEYGQSGSAACNVVAVCNNQNVFDITPVSATECDDRCPTFDAPGALSTAQGTACLHGSRGPLVCGSPYDRSTCGCTASSDGDGGVPPPTNDAGATPEAGAAPDAAGPTTDGGEGGAPPDVPGVWRCVTPASGCPATRPALGAPCVHELTCDYGACLFPGGMKVACITSWWTDVTPPGCGAN